uniref:Uncharacterized protein n=1 Tax=viral metagenome TaxID=1070528 RepID=A0A6H2A288_9ZZZZ
MQLEKKGYGQGEFVGVKIPKEVWHRGKIAAVTHNITLIEFIAEAINEKLEREKGVSDGHS